MKFGSKLCGSVILFAMVLLLLYLEILPTLNTGIKPLVNNANDTMSPAERGAQIGMLFAELPAWVKIWMHFGDIVIAASLLFVLWHREAQIYAFCMIVSHLFFLAIIQIIPSSLLGLEWAALSHCAWIPALLVLLKAWPSINKQTGFGVWATVAIAQILLYLMFDIPDSIKLIVNIIM